MSAEPRLKVVLCWHMHQPEYRDLIRGEYQLPWTYLHAIKDYVDMAAHLEAVPEARAVVNFVPVLLDQVEDYARQVRGFLENSGAIRDPLLAALASPVLPAAPEQRLTLIKTCRRANEQHLINRFAPYKRLVELSAWLDRHPDTVTYLGDAFLVDLLVWYHLAWLGETVRRADTRVKQLMKRASGYTLHDRRVLLEVIGELLGGVLGRYRALAERGQVELSMTPYAHPMTPLLLDLASAREAAPDLALPAATHYPDGPERARWHLREGVETFRRHFGFGPAGCWPAEGGVSTAAAELFGDAGFAWIASGESVLQNSLARLGHAPHACKEAWLYRPYAVGRSGIRCFFRDDGLSDLIGFTYRDWHADDAVANFVHHLETIAERCAGHPDHVLSIVLDGENAWEYYPENGYYFLSALYKRLAEHPRLQLTTFSDCQHGMSEIKPLTELVAGSWVYGTFSTWIGDRDKNRSWDMLAAAKRAYDEAMAGDRLSKDVRRAAARQLAVCEGSDWAWWFGDYNPAATVSDFERLYRLHLANLYQMIGVEPPEYLAQVFAYGRGTPQLGGVMRPGKVG